MKSAVGHYKTPFDPCKSYHISTDSVRFNHEKNFLGPDCDCWSHSLSKMIKSGSPLFFLYKKQRFSEGQHILRLSTPFFVY